MSRAKRESASRKYRPKNVALLLVAEAPPQALDRYFYFEQVRSNDWLFRAVVKGIFGNVPSRDDKAYWLLELKRSGVYLIDASKDPLEKPRLQGFVPDLVRRCRKLQPKCIILIKASVYDAAYAQLVESHLPVVNARLPFPSNGQQARFHRQFRKALKECARRAA